MRQSRSYLFFFWPSRPGRLRIHFGNYRQGSPLLMSPSTICKSCLLRTTKLVVAIRVLGTATTTAQETSNQVHHRDRYKASWIYFPVVRVTVFVERTAFLRYSYMSGGFWSETMFDHYGQWRCRSQSRPQATLDPEIGLGSRETGKGIQKEATTGTRSSLHTARTMLHTHRTATSD